MTTKRPDPGPLPELEWTEANYTAEREYCRATAHEFVVEHVDVEKQALELVVLGSVIRDERHFARVEVAEKMRARIAELEAEVARLSHVPTDEELDGYMTPEQRREEHEHLMISAEKTVRDTWGEPLRRIVDHVAGAMRLERRAARRDIAIELRKIRGTLQNITDAYAQLLSNDPRIRNYTEAVMVRSSDGVAFTVTIQRLDGKTPAQKMSERDEAWRNVMEEVLHLDVGSGPERSLSALSWMIDAGDHELTSEGQRTRDVFRRVKALIDDPPVSIEVNEEGVPVVK